MLPRRFFFYAGLRHLGTELLVTVRIVAVQSGFRVLAVAHHAFGIGAVVQ